jgi:gamma-glutamyltranspeptidase/glutathione hydrolase
VVGFFVNDSGIGFSRSDGERESVKGEWRTRSSTISPTVVLRDADVQMVIGAPGGGRIPTAIAQTRVYALDYGLDGLDAVRMPRIFPSASRVDVQLENGFDASTLRQVRAMGYRPAALSFGYARLYMIVRAAEGWIGVADPRHDGGVSGY